MRVEGDKLSVDSNLDDQFENTKFKLGKHTKEMVNKIFKAAHDGDQKELDELFEQVENRAKEMLKPGDFPDLPA